MKALHRIYDFLFYMLAGLLYTFSLVRAIFDATIFREEVANGRILTLCAVLLIGLYLLFFNKYTTRATVALLLVGGAVMLGYLWLHDFETEWVQSLTQLAEQLILFTQDVIPLQAQFIDIFILMGAGLVSVIAALNLRLHFNFYLLAFCGVAVLGIPLYMGWNKHGAGLSILVFLAFFLVALAKKLNLVTVARLPGGARRNASFALAMAPACLLVLALALVIPKPEINLDPVQAIENAPRNPIDLLSRLREIGARRELSYSREGARLGGPIELGDEVVMEVTAASRTYLTGSVRDTYTGGAWRRSSAASEDVPAIGDGSLRPVEYEQALFDSQSYYMRYYDQPLREVYIRPARRTRTIFAPAFSRKLWFDSEGFAPEMDRYGAILSNKSVDTDKTYGLQYVGWNYSSSYIQNVLRAASEPDADAMAAYLTLPDSLPERVPQLAQQLTAGYTNDYDKIQVLIGYLSQFPYTLEPERVPRGQELVDYFLFEGQEGYCVYYATALAVMGRSVGIPTRYVEGYVLPQEQDANGNYSVTGKCAHAWTEVFFPGFGWVPFEPTPSVYNNGAVPPPEQLPEPALPEEPEAPEQPPEQPELPEDEPSEPLPEESEPALPDDADAPDPGPGDVPEPAGSVWPVVVTVLVLLLLGGGGWLLLRLRVRGTRAQEERLRRLPEREAVQMHFARILSAAGACGYPLQQGETAHAWAARVEDALQFKSGATPSQLADIYARAAYSEEEVSAEDRALLQRCHRELLARLQQGRGGRLRYLFGRYIRQRF